MAAGDDVAAQAVEKPGRETEEGGGERAGELEQRVRPLPAQLISVQFGMCE